MPHDRPNSFPIKLRLLATLVFGALLLGIAPPRLARADESQPTAGGGEMNVHLPDLNDARFLGDRIGGKDMLYSGLIVSVLGIAFGMVVCLQVKRLPVHRSMLDVSELIYQTCKTYLIAAGQVLAALVAVRGRGDRLLFQILAGPRVAARGGHPAVQHHRHPGQLRRGLVRHSREHLRQFANGLRQPDGQGLSLLFHSAQGRHQHRHAADQRRAAADADHLDVHSRRLCRTLLHRFCHWRIAGRRGPAGGGGHLHQDRRHRRRHDEDRLQDQGRRRPQPRRDRRLHRRQCRRLGRSLGRRVRDLWRDGRGLDHVRAAGRQGSDGADSNPGLDLHDPRDDGAGLGGGLLHQRAAGLDALQPRPAFQLRVSA